MLTTNKLDMATALLLILEEDCTYSLSSKKVLVIGVGPWYQNKRCFHMMSDSRVISRGLTSSTDSIIDRCQASISEQYLIPVNCWCVIDCLINTKS